jgi:hypothetical protein
MAGFGGLKDLPNDGLINYELELYNNYLKTAALIYEFSI